MKKLQDLRFMLNEQFKPLYDLINLVGWHNLNNDQQQNFINLRNKINKLDKKITLLVNDYYGIRSL